MDRILKKYTTIPPHLYVDRGADIQLKKIIEDMQRPGYVLVARQMGKTNLLINAKRSLENDNRLFAYIDLSNLYDNEKDCYRHIINTIIELNYEIFGNIENSISEIRNKSLPPHNEYLRSLVVILNHYQGDIIIILDEIDALKSVEYSDNIFAQIRSNYFSRINFPVLERLSYVLSGVIEPSELIKDKNKSPFNIGDKIYLDDFTEEEHRTFIYKAKLRVSKEISKEIFEWTSGNPRLTFDICSEIESCIVKGQEVTHEVLNKIIREKYLTTFDLAPIDHIRELVKENSDIREAIKNIYAEQHDLINDEIKSKLYLFGIINSKFHEKTEIKNKIIREALNEEWLKSIDSEKTFGNGLSKYLNGLFSEAVEIFEYTMNSSNDKKDIEQSRYYLGLSYYGLENYIEAIKLFDINYNDKTIKNDSIAYHGISLLKTGKKQGLEVLENFISNRETQDYLYYSALLNLAIYTEDKIKALSFLKQLMYSLDNSLESVDTINELKALALFYQSNIYEAQSDYSQAIQKINKSLDYASNEDRPIIYYYRLLIKLKLGENIAKDRKDLVDSIITEKLYFSKKSSYPLNFDDNGVKEIIKTVFDIEDTQPFLDLVNYICNNVTKNKEEYIELLIDTGKLLKSDIDVFFDFIINNYKSDITNSQFIDIYRLITDSEENDKKYLTHFDKYYKLIQNDSDYELEEDDFGTLIITIRKFISTKEFPKAIDICSFVEKRIEKLNKEKLNNFLPYVSFWRTNIFFLQGNKYETLNSANTTLAQLKQIENSKNAIIDASIIATIKLEIGKIMEAVSISPAISINGFKSLGNQLVKVKYKNGKVSTRKFKHIENDLKLGKCIIIES